ncbi:glycosyltransferase [Clostridium chromiireducens]|uniref:Glycosyltransferase n=1 Tax=Clostridium chromiireducens TaxID=225345 RepID=A0A399IR06_9CLOT|nr:TPR domain-containing glycosyltransferase [Clostridium chromiireducens]RII33932.1 glycosyltransferase [Clostridium chromiireducens]
MPLSLCMIVKNEEKNLERCLESIKDIVDEMIIVDTGSTDNTIKIAEKYNAKIFFYKWDNSFANARNYSLSKASKDWILIMDADDVLKSEDKDKVIKLINNKNNKSDVYYGETLSYLGDFSDNTILSSMNIRLIKNGKGYKFSGDIHEQITLGDEATNKQDFIEIVDIKFYHYGYLDKVVNEKNKRKRNIDIIQKKLEENPDDAFMLYNMSTEYIANHKYEEALKYLKKAYKNFNPSFGFGFKLILKMIVCNEKLQNFDDCLTLIEDGLKFYPKCTDFEFYRTNIFFTKKQYFPAMESAKKCISMGESPVLLRECLGVGTYRPYYILGIIYSNIGDYNASYKCFDEVLKLNPKFSDAIFKMSETMAIKNISIDEIEKKLESYFDNINQETNLLLSKVFYNQNKFDIAYNYVEKAESFNENILEISFYKGIYLFYLGNYNESLESLYKIKEGEHYKDAIYCSILCELFVKNYENVDNLLNITRNFDESEETMVYKTFISIIKENKYTQLANNKENSKKFIKPIFNLLEILLRANCLEQFEKAVQLLNLIYDENLLILLGKLYYKYRYFNAAYELFIRSIKMYEIVDAEALYMMQTILLSEKN